MSEQNKSHGVLIEGEGRQCQVCKYLHGPLYQCVHYNSTIISKIKIAELKFMNGVQEQIREMRNDRASPTSS